MGFGEGERFGFVADDVVCVRDYGVEGVFEELADERGGEAEGEGLDERVESAESMVYGVVVESVLTLFFAAASSATARIAGGHTVKKKPPM